MTLLTMISEQSQGIGIGWIVATSATALGIIGSMIKIYTDNKSQIRKQAMEQEQIKGKIAKNAQDNAQNKTDLNKLEQRFENTENKLMERLGQIDNKIDNKFDSLNNMLIEILKDK